MPKSEGGPRSALARILDTPNLARIVPRLQPELLHRVIERCGLEDCAELIALATPQRLSAVLDLDLWRDARAGLGEQFDAERPDCFHRVMHGFRRLSNSLPEIDGLHDLLGDGEQALVDLALGRERRREAKGYMSGAQARAFLDASRQLRLEDATAPPLNAIAAAYFRAIDPQTAHAAAADATPVSPDAHGADDSVADAAALVDALVEAGLLPPQRPRSLQGAGDRSANRLARLQMLIEIVCARDEAACARRHEELAFLANAIMAACTIQDRPFTVREASDAATAVCNLGLENWPKSWLPSLDEDFLVAQGLVGVFQVGWTVLHREVCLPAAERLLAVLSGIQCDNETQAGLDALRRKLLRCLTHGAPWHAHDAFDVLAILDVSAWAALLTLIGECPVIHGAMSPPRNGARAIDPWAFDFISENRQIASVRNFLGTLPDRLGR